MAVYTHPRVEVVNKEFKRDENGTVLCTDRIEVKFDGVTLDLAQSWEDGEELAPIFSGACWAGTVVWQAALDLCDYMSEHLRKDLKGATVVELGCGIGVPGMIARLLGAKVVLTEQDELLSLLDRNLAKNFEGDVDGIRHAALDWERKEDTDGILASLRPVGTVSASSRSTTAVTPATSSGGVSDAGRNVESGVVDPGDDGIGDVRQRHKSSEEDHRIPSTVAEGGNGLAAVSGGKGEIERQGEVARGSTRLDFILCADCVFEPLYGDSWKALAKVMARLGDAGTTVLCSFERRGDDGVPGFLDAIKLEGFGLQMVFRAFPVELYEFSKGGAQAFRGVALENLEGDDGDRTDGGGVDEKL